MKKASVGILVGAIAGVIDVIPMMLQKLSWDANLSAFTMWVIVGFLVSVVDLKLNPILKGILIAFLVLLPNAVLIGAQEPASLVPIGIMTLVLGSAVGYVVSRF